MDTVGERGREGRRVERGGGRREEGKRRVRGKEGKE